MQKQVSVLIFEIEMYVVYLAYGLLADIRDSIFSFKVRHVWCLHVLMNLLLSHIVSQFYIELWWFCRHLISPSNSCFFFMCIILLFAFFTSSWCLQFKDLTFEVGVHIFFNTYSVFSFSHFPRQLVVHNVPTDIVSTMCQICSFTLARELSLRWNFHCSWQAQFHHWACNCTEEVTHLN